jgi:hypothetical protein
MCEIADSTLNNASLILGIIFITISILSLLKQESRAIKAFLVFLCFLLVCLNIPLGMHGYLLSWLAIALFSFWLIFLLISLAQIQ